jgi:hypothetical protein
LKWNAVILLRFVWATPQRRQTAEQDVEAVG